MPAVKELHVNGAKRPVDTDADRSLLSVLRDDLGLTGAKYGCGEGECGACTVLLDGRRVPSGTTRVGTAAGKPIRKIEGLAAGDKFRGRSSNAEPSSAGPARPACSVSAVGETPTFGIDPALGSAISAATTIGP